MIVIGTTVADVTIIILTIAGIVTNAAGGRKNAATTTMKDAMTTAAGTNIIITGFAVSWKVSCADVSFFGGLADEDRAIAGLDASA